MKETINKTGLTHIWSKLKVELNKKANKTDVTISKTTIQKFEALGFKR